MTITQSNNKIVRFFQGMVSTLSDLIKELSPEPKDRAVRTWDIMMTVQKELDSAGGTNEFGEPVSSGYVLDVYIDDAGTFAIVTRSDGKLYKVPVFVDEQSQITTGTEQEVFMEFTPVSRSVMIKREVGADGKETGVVRWIAAPACTAFLNRSGEIDSRALFDKFVEYAERSNDYPELDFFHLGEHLTLGQADLLFRDDVNFCASGTFYDLEIARAAIKGLEANSDYWGTSIAYLPTKEAEKIRSTEGLEIPVFNDGICRFISLLPEDTAASILTSISTKEEVNRMKQEQKDALRKLIGDDLTDEVEAKLDQNNRSAKEPGVIVRQQAAQPAAPAVAQGKGATTQAPAPVTVKAPAKKRELSEDLKLIFASGEFKSAVVDIVTEMRKADAVTDPEETEEDAVGEPVAEARSTDELLRQVLEEVGELKKNREQSLQEVLDDLPSKVAVAKLVRPRGRATQLPENLNAKERRSLPLAEIAADTIARKFGDG